MKAINKEPIWVDFGNADEDGAVRLFLPLESVSHKKIDLDLSEGQNVWVTDGEIEETGVLKFRKGIWVSIPLKGTTKDVDKDAPYYIGNTKSNS